MDTTERPRPQCTAPQFRISLTNLVDCLGVFSQSLVNESPLILSYRAAGDPLEMRRGRTTSAPPPTHAIGHSPLRAFFVDLEPRSDRACRWTPGQPDPEQCAECQALAGCRRLTIERCAQSRQSTSVRYRHVISALLRPTSHTGRCANHVRPRHCCNPVAEDATTSAVTYEQTTVSKAIIRSSVLRDALMEVDWSDTTACGRLSLSPLSPHFELSVDYATGLGYKARDIPAPSLVRLKTVGSSLKTVVSLLYRQVTFPQDAPFFAHFDCSSTQSNRCAGVLFDAPHSRSSLPAGPARDRSLMARLGVA